MRRCAIPLVLLAACSKPAPQLEIEVIPNHDRVYALAEAPKHEAWQVGVRVKGTLEALELEYSARGVVVIRERYEGAALKAREQEPGTYLDFGARHPSALGVDSLRLRGFAGERMVGQRTVLVDRYVQKGKYRLPLEGCWFVSSGHDPGLEHRRWYNRAHFAWDFVRVDAVGNPALDRAVAASYFGFGQPVVAPGDGVVVAAEGSHADRPPGSPGPAQEVNYILLELTGGEHAKLAHLKQGSVRVAAGQRVRAGEQLAEVGNSGQSDAPHLHFQFQTWPGEDPLPIELSGYRSTSNRGVALPIDRGRPRRGEFVCAGEDYLRDSK